MELAGGFGPINTGCPLRDVEIDFNHAALGPDQVHPEGKRHFKGFADDGATVPKKQVFRDLHGNGRGAANGALLLIKCVFHNTLQFNPVHTMVAAEAGILRTDHCSRECGRDLVKADPILAEAVADEKALDHDIGNGWRHHGINKCQQKRQNGKPNQHLDDAARPKANAVPEIADHRFGLRFRHVVVTHVLPMGSITGKLILAPVTQQEFEIELAAVAARVDQLLQQLLPAIAGDRVQAAMRYAVLGQGKRLRPFLVVQSARLFGIDDKFSLRVGAALEALHCYSLVHDDLPAMDNDDLRRGQPTVHRKFDEATAILTGDGLLTFAFEELAHHETHPSAETRNTLVLALAKAAGTQGMVGGQMVDIEAETKNFSSYVEIAAMQRMKTGALFSFACQAGPLMAETTSEPLRIYADKIGLAFQIADDILDVESSAVALGKATQKDKGKGKATFVDLLGLHRAKAEAKTLVDDAIAALTPFGDKAGMLASTARYIIDRQR